MGHPLELPNGRNNQIGANGNIELNSEREEMGQKVEAKAIKKLGSSA